jgi:hypothetical protein
MRPSDTHPEIQRLLDAHALRMTPAEKAQAVRSAWRTARALQLAGLRELYPRDSEERLRERLAERWLGPELYRRAREALRKGAR